MSDLVPQSGESPYTHIGELSAQVRRVAELRREQAAVAAMLRELRAAFDEQTAPSRAVAAAVGADLVAAEAVVAALTLAHYRTTRDKAPTPGVAVKEYERLQYDEAAAFAWAREKQMALVPEQLDRKAFEKIAKATPLPFVSVSLEPRVQIASDLEKALGVAP